jgi:hypothetical protein
MSVIHVPRPSRNAMDPNRPVNALLLAQVEHLQHAERRLPLRYRTEIYTHAIKTEGEAAAYIREVTEAIHKAHEDTDARRSTLTRRPRKGLTIAAAAAEPSRKPGSKAKNSKAKKKSSAAKRRKK